MLVALRSSKGGSGTSVVAAALALTLARSGSCRLVDLSGDQAAILGVPAPAGLAAWLAGAPTMPTEVLEGLELTVVPGLTLLSSGPPPALPFAPEAGAALVTALRDGPPGVLDAGLAPWGSAAHAAVEVADLSILVVRGCYLALRRAVTGRHAARCDGIVLVDEPGRVLGAEEVAGLLERPVLARVPVRPSIARAVDAGVLACGLPAPLARAAESIVEGLALPVGWPA